MIRTFPRVALAGLLVAGLSGCVPMLPLGQPSASPTETPEAPAAASAIDDRCDGLTPTGDDGPWDSDLH